MQVRLVKAWKNCVAEISLKSGLQVLLTTLFCGESGQAHSISPVHVQKIQLGGVLLVEYEAVFWQSDLVLMKDRFTILSVEFESLNI